MTSMLQDVVRYGTARRALALGRGDLAGKTGTTNEQRDAWFSGFNPDLVATAWVGFDKLQPLGARETGSRAALPVWIGFMEDALDGLPERSWEVPDGLVTVRIDPQSGLLAGSDFPDAIFETFREGSVPQRAASRPAVAGGEPGATGNVTEQLF
jgi:penicillin-binding protein 1A